MNYYEDDDDDNGNEGRRVVAGDVRRRAAASPRRLLVERFTLSFFLSTPERRIGEQTARTKLPRAKDFLRDASCERDCQELHYPPSLRPVIRSFPALPTRRDAG